MKPLLYAAYARWHLSRGDRDTVKCLSVTVRKEIHARKSDDEAFLITGVNGREIDGCGIAMRVGVCELPTGTAVGRVP